VHVANFREPTEKEVNEARARKLPLFYDPENDKQYVQHGVGSGIILKPGVILTNHHVIRKAERIRIALGSGRSIGVDPEAILSDVRTDLAIIKLPYDLPAAMKEEMQTVAEFADSDKDVHVGEWVLAMGSPLGLRQTVTHGIISAKGRLLSSLDLVELLQTDAAINPGNSGGPLFDQFGRVVGINAMIASDTGLNQGIGFAVPSNTVRKISDQLLTNGEVPRGFLGIGMDDLPGPDAKAKKIDGGAILVKTVEPGSAAAKAGIQRNDILLRVNNEPLSRHLPIRHVRQLVADIKPGTEITVEIMRGDERKVLTVTVDKRPANLP
jgi:S1-C subfamily serine protease